METLNKEPEYVIIQTRWFDRRDVGIVAVDRDTPGQHWSAYIGYRAGVLDDHAAKQSIALNGTKLSEYEARPFFPWLEDGPYWY